MSYLVLVTFLVISLPLLWLLLLRKNASAKLPPGPRSLPIIGSLHMLGSQPHRSLEKLAQKYGPIMSLKLGLVQTIIVSSPEAAQLFLKQHDLIFASRPVTQATTHLLYGAKDIAFAPYGDYWRRVRKICTLHLLTVSKVESFEGLRKNKIEMMVERLKAVSEKGEIVEVEKLVGELIDEITFKMIVGKSKEEDKRYDLKPLIRQAMELLGAFNIADYIPFLAYFDVQGLTRRMKRVSNDADKILEDIINDHLKDEHYFEHQHDILTTILTLMDNPNDEFLSSSFDRDCVKAILLDLFSAGIDSTSYAITWAFSTLLKEPRVMKLLRNELDAIVGKSRMVQESDLSKLPYLDAVVKETLRLYPVGPLVIPRESSQDVVINGYFIPNKSRVIINFWAIARDSKVWGHNATEFYPERLINKDIGIFGQNYEYIPFGSGRRGCPGIQLGMVMLKIILAQLVHCFDWELPHGMRPEDIDMTEKFGLAMGRASKLHVIPSFRLDG